LNFIIFEMVEINKNNLEEALSNSNNSSEPQVSKDEEIGIHRGAFSTLNNERAELFKMLGNVEAIMQMHLKRLEELGVKMEQKK